MIRTSVLLLLLGLTFGLTAKPLKPLKPLKPWDEGSNAALQKSWELVEDKAMGSWAVEPPEDMDQTSSDMEPNMKIWKNLQLLKAEGDLDHLHHPSTEELLKALRETQPQEDVLPAAENLKVETHQKLLEPEDDMDGVYHAEEVLQKFLAPLVVGYEAEPVVQRVHLEPERDEDDMYHSDVDSGLMEVPEVQTEVQQLQGRLHLEPEQDMDEVYHRDVPQVVLVHSQVRPEQEAWPSLRRHSEPEEDLDELYHQ